MLERKGAGVDKPGTGPRGRESGELLLLYNETSNALTNGSGPKFERTASASVICWAYRTELPHKTSGVHWPRVIGDVMTVCELSVYWPHSMCVSVCVSKGEGGVYLKLECRGTSQ